MDKKVASSPLLTASIAVILAVTIALPVEPQSHAGRNINMVSGTTLPGGDPYMQRQSEGSCADSTANRAHVLCGANDYRAVDIPGLPESFETGDAWLSYFISTDGSMTWTSSLLPGFPQDTSPEGQASPLNGFQAGADPVVRSGPHGMFLYSGIVFNRGLNATSRLVVSRFIDLNNKENGNPIERIDSIAVDDGPAGLFIDKPWLAVDIPRNGGTCTIQVEQEVYEGGGGGGGAAQAMSAEDVTTELVTREIPAFNAYISYSVFAGHSSTNPHSRLYFVRSEDCGETWLKEEKLVMGSVVVQGSNIAIDPTSGDIYVTWRQFEDVGRRKEPNAIMIAKSTDFGRSFSDQQVVALLDPMDQPTVPKADEVSPAWRGFRFNSFPTSAVDNDGRVYVAWSERGMAPPPEPPPSSLDSGDPPTDARILMTHALNGTGWSTPMVVDQHEGRGHQLQPSMIINQGRLQIAYLDGRGDLSRSFAQWILDPIPNLMPVCGVPPGGTCIGIPFLHFYHTMDVRLAEYEPGPVPQFLGSTWVTRYRYAFFFDPAANSGAGKSYLFPLDANPYNFPMYNTATQAFDGDYIDIAAGSPMVMDPVSGEWQFNTGPPATSSLESTTTPLQSRVSHVVWTDNRNVKPPADGRWDLYTPPDTAEPQPIGASHDPSLPPRLPCDPNNSDRTGMRNQDLYSSRVTDGLYVSAPGNSKAMWDTENNMAIERGFVVFVANTIYDIKAYQMEILPPPAGVQASFVPEGETGYPVTAIEAVIPRRASIARTVFAKVASDSVLFDSIQIKVTEIEMEPCPAAPDPNLGETCDLSEAILLVYGEPIISDDPFNTTPNHVVFMDPGLTDSLLLNPDPWAPDLFNPDLFNDSQSTISISEAEVHNPDLFNPDLFNPDLFNPDLFNPDLFNPDLFNPDLFNPDLFNPDLFNPDLFNPDLYNPDLVSYLNPDLFNPDLTSPDLFNPDLFNPDLFNPDLFNPDLFNPDLFNPDLFNPDLFNSGIENAGWTAERTVTVANIGNTTSAYAVRPLLSSLPHESILFQMMIYKVYKTPLALGCDLQGPDGLQAEHHELVTNITTPEIFTPQDFTNPDLFNPDLFNSSLMSNATVFLAPGEEAKILIRVLDTDKTDEYVFDPGTFMDPVVAPEKANTGAPAPTPALIITTGTVDDGVVGDTGYWQSLTSVGGTPPVTWALASGSGPLPPGLTLSSTGVISDTGSGPTTVGSYSFTVEATDAASVPQTDTRTYTVNVSNPLTITCCGLPNGVVGVTNYNYVYTATGGLGPLTWSSDDGFPGLTFDPDTQILSGTPTTAGAFSMTVYVQDSSDPPQTASYLNNSTFETPLVITTASPLPVAGVGLPYPATFSASGGDPGRYWTHTGGTLPPGLLLLTDGTFWNGGTPTTLGSYSFEVTVQDALDPVQMHSKTFDLTVATARLYFTSQPYSIPVGQQGTTLVGVKIEDFDGSPIPGVSVDVAIWDNPVGGTLSLESLTVGCNTEGICDFFPPAIDTAGVGYTLRISTSSVGPLLQDISDPFNVTGVRTTGSLTLSRGDASGTSLADGRVLVAGGGIPGPNLRTNTGEVFDPAAGSGIGAFSSVSNTMANTRTGHDSVLLPNGKIFIAGGENATDFTLRSTALYDPGTNSFSAGPDMPNDRRTGPLATVLSSGPNAGMVLIVGGSSEAVPGVLTTELYDPVTNTFAAFGTTPNVLTSRRFQTVTLLPDGRVLIAGGFDWTDVYLDSTELYDPLTSNFSLGPTMPGGLRGQHFAVLLSDGKVLLGGGWNGTSLTSAMIYDPSVGPTGSFALTGSMGGERLSPGAVLLQSGKVLLVGGYGSGASLSTTEVYDPVLGTFSPGPSMGTARSFIEDSVSLLPDGSVLVVGGYDGANYLNTAEVIVVDP